MDSNVKRNDCKLENISSDILSNTRQQSTQIARFNFKFGKRPENRNVLKSI